MSVEAVHVCSCGRSFDEAMWAALPLAGFQIAEDPDYLLELRECHCGSHRSIQLEGPGFWLDMAAKRIAEARQEAHAELSALSLSYMQRALTCLRQADQLQTILLRQRERRAQPAAIAKAAE